MELPENCPKCGGRFYSQICGYTVEVFNCKLCQITYDFLLASKRVIARRMIIGKYEIIYYHHMYFNPPTHLIRERGTDKIVATLDNIPINITKEKLDLYLKLC